VAINTTGLSPHPARAAASMPFVNGTCPGCGVGRTLFLATGGWVTCANIDCTAPQMASDVLDGDV